MSPILAAACAQMLLFSSLAGQSTVHRFAGEGYGSHFGSAVSAAGDVDGDGVTDVVAGAPYHGVASGAAWIYSGADGSVLAALRPPEGAGHFGFAVAGAGDVDRDGHDDVLVGAPTSDCDGRANCGAAWLFSGADGTALASWSGSAADERFGHSVAAAGDVDADGVPDVIVGTGRGNHAGVFSGADGERLHRLQGDAPDDRLGVAVAGAGDLDGDGHAELLVGADQSPARGPGYARLYSGRDGSERLTLRGDRPGGNFGGSVAAVGDVDGDGVADVAIGSGTRDDVRSLARLGPARVHSGRDGALLHEIDLPGAFVARAGDVDGDGCADVLVGAPSFGDDHAGLVQVIGGRHGRALASYAGELPGHRLGMSLDALGDLDGDGSTEIVVGGDELLIAAPPRGSIAIVSLAGQLQRSGGDASGAALDRS